ncbi:TMEM165/GDT1 family protein [Candidatus Fermentibacterales bacterium]|nr:TMEM165/GDT1 family protein [Candidatus Fermentibacterales bacterium]
MNLRALLLVFGTIFLAELGDKTQLATFLFASDRQISKLSLFIGASLALIATSAIGVLLGDAISRLVSEKLLRTVAGAGFVGIGIWTIVRA